MIKRLVIIIVVIVAILFSPYICSGIKSYIDAGMDYAEEVFDMQGDAMNELFDDLTK